MEKKIKVAIIITAIVMALVYDFLFPTPILGLNFGIFMLLLLVCSIALWLANNKRLSNYWSFLFCIPILWYAGSVAIYNSTFVHVAAPLASIFLLILFLFWSGVADMPIKKVKRILPLSLILFIGRFFSKIISPYRNLIKTNTKRSGKILIALVILVPLILIFGALFASADLIFREWMNNLFDFEVDAHNVWRVFRTIVLFVFLGGVFAAHALAKRFSKPLADKREEKPKEKKRDPLIANIVLGVLNLFFLAFIVIQIMFLFGGHEVIQKYDISYADYVHQGFYQMCAIAVFVLIISYVMYRINKSDKFDLTKSLNSIFIIQAIVIVASALKRMILYQDAYGLTQLRFLVWHFIFYIGLILLALLLVILFKKHYRLFVKMGLVISIVYLMFMTGINMQAKIAKVNIDRYLSGQDKEIDMVYLKKMSTDIYSQIKRLENNEAEQVRYYYNQWLVANQQMPEKQKAWQNYTLSEIKFWADEGNR